MIQFDERKFGDILPFEDAHEMFIKLIENGERVMSLHYGSKIELEGRKKKASIEENIEDLKKRIKALESVKSEILRIPTPQEITAVREGVL